MHVFSLTAKSDEIGLTDNFIVSEFPNGEELKYVLEKIYELPPEIRSGRSIVLRPSVKTSLDPTIILKIFSDKKVDARKLGKKYWQYVNIRRNLEKTFRRFPHKPIYLLCSFNYKIFLSCNINLLSSPNDEFDHLEQKCILDSIRETEIDYLVEQGKCILPALGNAVYRVPSGRLVRSFLRVGNLQISRSALDAIFFWILPYLKGCVGIISDTWSISSISQNISRRLVSYDQTLREVPPIEMLGGYHNNLRIFGEETAEIISRFLRRVNFASAEKKVLILISATHTGGLLRLVKSSLDVRGIGIDNVNFLTIFKLSDDSIIPTLRDYSKFQEFKPVSEEEKTSKIVLDINKTIHFPITTSDILKKGFILTHTKPYTNFYKAYGEFFGKIHYSDDNGIFTPDRHHMIYIDTEKFVKHKEFKAKFISLIAKISPKPKIIIYPSHPAAETMAQYAKEYYSDIGFSCHSHSRDTLKLDYNFPEDLALRDTISNLTQHDGLLILDDAYISGRRITGYQEQLRSFDCVATLHYLVGISRPCRKSSWKNASNVWHRARGPEQREFKNSFQFVEQLILPNWSRDKCPWCNEQQLSNDHSICRNSLDEKTGLEQDNLFIRPSIHEKMKLKGGSFLGPKGTSQADIFIAVSGILQTLRTERTKDGSPNLGKRTLLTNTIIDMEEYLSKLTDGVLRSAYLRAALPEELIYQDDLQEIERTTLLKSYYDDPSYADLRSEIFLSKIANRIPNWEKT